VTDVGRDQIAATAAVIRRHIRRTPVIEVEGRDLGVDHGRPGADLRLVFKLELTQKAGSFKARGAFANLLLRQVPAAGVVAASGGNHGAAVAHAARELNIPARIYVPTISTPAKVERIRATGAELVLVGERYDEALNASEAWAQTSGALRVHAFDQDETLMGAGTLGLELEDQIGVPDAVMVPVGGGGLIGGIQTALGDRMRVVAVEPETSVALHAGLEHGAPTPVEPTSIADGLNAPFAGALPLQICAQLERVLVTEQEIEDGFRFLYERAKLACEPAGAVATAAWLAGKIQGERPVVVVSGGNVASQTAAAILARR
jgi:threonine dehydratase